MSYQPERPYVDDDLTGNKQSLIKMIQRQQGKWPHKKFQQSHVTVAQLKSALLDPTYGFTTNKPAPAAPSNAAMIEAPPAAPLVSPVTAALTVSDTPDVEIVNIRIYIEDGRLIPVEKTMAVLSIPIFDRTNCSVDGLRVLGKDVISSLQHSNSAIEIVSNGIVRVSVPDTEEPSWKMPFVRMAHGQSLESMEFNPQALEIPETRRLKLFIDNLTSAPVVKAEDESLNSVISTSTEAPTANITEDQVEQPGVSYLLEKLSSRSGYAVFTGNRGRVLSNPDIITGWRFAVDFTSDYNKVWTPAPQRIKITKSTIQKALRIGSTWLANAHTAIQIIDTYGRDKQHAATEVIELLELVDDKAEGSAALHSFLIEWKKDHPI